ncbi:hypothetical protein B0H13DRAFT_1914481 [Mycena leptocephala]|nr:hypothetical protein B0H13DRAFT_1914481 [Mycena leptocephala]
MSLPLGEGVYNNVHGNIIYNNFSNTKRRPEEIEGSSPQAVDGSDLLLPTHRVKKRPRLREENGIKIIRSKHLKLIQEIGSGPGYFLHTGQHKSRAVIVKVFNRGPTVRQMSKESCQIAATDIGLGRKQLESTVALSKGLMHPNVLRIEGISSSASLMHFIAYESVYWKNVQGRDEPSLYPRGISAVYESGVSINPRSPEADAAGFQEPQDDQPWGVFNALCQNVLMSANRVLHTDTDEEIDRDPATLDVLRPSSVSQSLVEPSQNIQEELPVPPRREYVWRTIDRGQQSLATVAHRINRDLDVNPSPLRRLTQKDRRSTHRCAGYLREEITLATTTLDSAVVVHDNPSPQEICFICHRVVVPQASFRCIKCRFIGQENPEGFTWPSISTTTEPHLVR